LEVVGPTANWQTAAVSANGSKIVAGATRLGAFAGPLFASDPGTTPGTTGSISGGKGDAVELIYLGNGLYDVLSHEGDGVKVE